VISLPAATSIASVRLIVSDVERSLSFYEGVLGFQRGTEADGHVPLMPSGGDRPVLYLREDPLTRAAHRRTAGLYHFAVRLPSREDLAALLRHIMSTGYSLDGAADHGVSEALYLTDPESNGIEIYIDRPRSEWRWEKGQIMMFTDALDIRSLQRSGTPENDTKFVLPPRTDIGHIHLQIGELARGEAFYHELLGFDVTQRSYPGALFLSAGGYHHHIGLNIWGGRGLPPRVNGSPGLESFRISLPEREAWNALRERLKGSSGVNIATISGASSHIVVRDEDGISVEIEGPAAE
jgi:catechol 2,3-dioxygenase